MRPLNTSPIRRFNTARRLGAALGLWLLLIAAAPAFAENPAIVNIGVATQGELVLVDATLIDGFTDTILEAIDSGVPMTFTYHLELRRANSLWLDELVASTTIKNTVQYDSLKSEYKFSSLGKNVKRRILTKDKDRYQKLMLNLEGIPIASAYKLDMTEKYYIRVKADLQPDRFWFPFNHIFFFVPFKDIKTSWAVSSPLKVPGPADRIQSQSAETPGGLNHVARSFNQ